MKSKVFSLNLKVTIASVSVLILSRTNLFIHGNKYVLSPQRKVNWENPQLLAGIGLWQKRGDLPSFSAAFLFPDCKQEQRRTQPGIVGSGYGCPHSTHTLPAYFLLASLASLQPYLCLGHFSSRLAGRPLLSISSPRYLFGSPGWLHSTAFPLCCHCWFNCLSL